MSTVLVFVTTRLEDEFLPVRTEGSRPFEQLHFVHCMGVSAFIYPAPTAGLSGCFPSGLHQRRMSAHEQDCLWGRLIWYCGLLEHKGGRMAWGLCP